MASDIQTAAAGAASSAMQRKVLGLPALFAAAVGIVVGQNAIVSVLQGIGYGGYDFLVVLGIGFVFALCNVATFSELSLMFPRAGGLGTYTEAAIGSFPAIVATVSGYVVVAMFGLSAELKIVEDVFQQLAPGMIPNRLLPLLLLAVFVGLNIRGIDLFAKLQNFLTFTTIAFCLVLGASAIGGLGAAADVGHVPYSDWGTLGSGVFGLVTLGIWAFAGIEFICPLIEETRNPARDIPRAMLAGSGMIFAVYITLAVGAGMYLTRSVLLEAAPHLTYAQAVFGQTGRLAVAVVALTASGSVVNTVLASVSRILSGMAKNGQVPKVFGKLHPRFDTPWVAVLFLAVSSALPFLLMGNAPEAIVLLLIAGSTSWLIAYIVAHLDVIVLRLRRPDLARPYKSPLFPLPQVIGIIGMSYAVLHNAPSPELTRTVLAITAGIVASLGVVAAIWVKLVMRRGLFEPVKPGH